MAIFEDYYEILQVHLLAEPEVIEAAYKKLAAKYHPDRNPSPSAQEKMKKINNAHDVLSDPERRKRYDAELLEKKGSTTSSAKDRTLTKPKPIIDPPGIIFKNIKPGETKKTSFLVINIGGPYTKIHISNPDSWLKISDWHSISTNDELPLKVNILAQADDSGSKRSENIYVKLDDIQTHITVIMEPKIHTQPPKARSYSPPPPPPPPPQPKGKLEYCPNPKCRQRSLFWDRTKQLWECLNPECRRIYTASEFKQSKEQPVRQSPPAKPGTHTVIVPPLWLVNILESKRFWKLLICSAVIWLCWTGISIGLALGLAIPILLLYAVRAILRRFLTGYRALASQRRLSQIFYSIRKSSFLRFAIILATIALLVTTIWSMVAFIYQLPEVSSAYPYLLRMLIIIIAQIWLLSWLCGTLKHSRQISSKPKFAIVFWSLFAVAVFCAFVGISPFSDIKTLVVNWWEQTTTATGTSVEPPSVSVPPPSSTNPSPTSTLYEDNQAKYPHRVWTNDYTYLIKGNGQPVELYENPNAKNPTWDQLRSFLRTDNTDKITYVPDDFVCVDFAEMLHNNAERAEIKCGLVVLYLYPDYKHACNTFETVDRGLVFIDCTGLEKYQTGPYDEDKIVNIQLGADYIPKFISSDRLGYTTWTIQDIGTVTRYQICWIAGEIMDYQYDYATASYVPPSYIPPSVPSIRPPYGSPPTQSDSMPVCRTCCENRCSKYQGTWRNGCIDDCMKGGTDKWSWE